MCYNTLMKKLLERIDPYQQSFFYFKWSLWGILFCGLAIWWCWNHWDGWVVKTLLDNIFVYLPNYLTHEMLGHNMVGRLGYLLLPNDLFPVARWWSSFMGNGVETLLPILVALSTLRLSGGRYLLPLITYWLATTFYGAGIYACDARASKLALTSSDMMTNWAPGEVKGDWYNILQPLGLLDYDIIIGKTFIFISVVLLVLSIWSVWYYLIHGDQFLYGRK